MIFASPLENAVDEFTRLVLACSEVDLARPWAWIDHREGVRFAFFRNYEGLRALTGSLDSERLQAGNPMTEAQHALAGHHLAYRDLLAVLLGVDDSAAARPPSPTEWPVSVAVKHIIGAERAFFGVIDYARQRAGIGEALPAEMPAEYRQALWEGDTYLDFTQETPLSILIEYYEGLHRRVLAGLEGIADHELDLPATFWESSPMPIRYRLYRFDSHLRQHTVQVEKALAAQSLPYNEARRLLRLVHNALAQLEGVRLGAPDLGAAAMADLAEELAQRTAEIALVLGQD